MKITDTLARVFFLSLACSGSATWSFADEPRKAPATPKSTPVANPLSMLENNGVTFPINYTGEVLGNLSGGYRRGSVYDGMLTLGLQVDLEKLAGWKGGTLYASALYPHGRSITDRYVHDLNTVSNVDADHDFRLYEAWAQQDFDDGKFSIRAGQILADAEFFVCENSGIFLSGAFGALPIVSQNFNAPIFPTAGPGIRFRFTPNAAFYAQAGLFIGDAGDQYTTNRHGTRFFCGSNGTLFLGEIGYTFNPSPESGDNDGKQQASASRPLSGTYKLGGYYHTANFQLLDGAGARDGDYGIYAIADQEIWHMPGDPDQGLKIFVSAGFAPDDRNSTTCYFNTGFNYTGLIPTRDKDVFGIGFNYTKISDDLLDDTGAPVSSHHETVIEVSYLAPINDWLTLQPDFQYIVNPGATENLPNALVAGLRFSITF